MPLYDYRCSVCGAELEIAHRMSASIERQPHVRPQTQEACDGSLERLIAKVALNKGGVGQSTVSDARLERAGFTKYVRGAKGYEKAFGTAANPNFVQRE